MPRTLSEGQNWIGAAYTKWSLGAMRNRDEKGFRGRKSKAMVGHLRREHKGIPSGMAEIKTFTATGNNVEHTALWDL